MPEVADCQQGSPRWREIRRGIPTATGFGNIVTPSTCKKSASARSYMCKLVAAALGEDTEGHGSKEMQLGIQLEANARAAYEWDTDNTVREVAFLFSEQRQWGCSPDGLVGDDGGCELKVPSLHTHLEYLLREELPATYRGQVYGSLFVSGREWWDFYSYSRWEAVPGFFVRTTKDDEGYQKWREAFEPHLVSFIAELNALRERVGLPPLGSDKTPALLERFAPQSPQYTSETISMAEGMEVTYF